MKRIKYPGSARAFERRLRKYGDIARPDPGWRPPPGARKRTSRGSCQPYDTGVPYYPPIETPEQKKQREEWDHAQREEAQRRLAEEQERKRLEAIRLQEEQRRREQERQRRLREERLKWEAYVKTPEGQRVERKRLIKSARNVVWIPAAGFVTGGLSSVTAGFALGFLCLIGVFLFSRRLVGRWRAVMSIAHPDIIGLSMAKYLRTIKWPVYTFFIMSLLVMVPTVKVWEHYEIKREEEAKMQLNVKRQEAERQRLAEQQRLVAEKAAADRLRNGYIEQGRSLDSQKRYVEAITYYDKANDIYYDESVEALKRNSREQYNREEIDRISREMKHPKREVNQEPRDVGQTRGPSAEDHPSRPRGSISIASGGNNVSFDCENVDVVNFLRQLSEASASAGGYNVFVQPGVQGRLTMRLTNVPVLQALNVIAKHLSLSMTVEGNVVLIGPKARVGWDTKG